ncbi:LrgB family protein [Irregularibacter muris]|uniref:LrgB family protein n=1 Tax=Irregularibacter muris TaxID=1796619 RepID=A0AAE3HDU7_9FIRM|nr:LrgB family protein [Irregularibacter muris]MCR1898316.1 LrgB family protein [Irregularibacter muris]
MINALLQNTAFGVALTLLAYEIGKWIQKKTGLKVLSPLITATAFIISVLVLFHIDYSTYQPGANIIIFFVGPATVSFAVPLYKNIRVIKDNLMPILVGLLGGLFTGMISVLGLCYAFGINQQLTTSMLPKSVTSAIGFAISEMIGGVAEITLVLIVVAGVTGYVVGEFVFKILKIDDPVIKGIALGTNSHVVGTAKAMELGEKEGALSSAAITLAGLLMVFLVPLFIKIVGL